MCQVRHKISFQGVSIINTKLNGFRDLRVWQDAMNLVVDVMKIADKLPHQEKFGLALQIKRSAVSVPSNIAEGWGRNGKKEFCHFLDISYGSLCELDTQLEIAKRCYAIEIEKLVEQCESIRKQITALQKTLKLDGKL